MGIIDEIKSVGKVLQEAGKIEQYQQILDIQRKLLEMDKSLYDLDRENRELKERLAEKQKYTFENNAYWIILDSKKEGPFCSRCFDVGGFSVRMHKSTRFNVYICKNCNIQVPA